MHIMHFCYEQIRQAKTTIGHRKEIANKEPVNAGQNAEKVRLFGNTDQRFP